MNKVDGIKAISFPSLYNYLSDYTFSMILFYFGIHCYITEVGQNPPFSKTQPLHHKLVYEGVYAVSSLCTVRLYEGVFHMLLKCRFLIMNCKLL